MGINEDKGLMTSIFSQADLKAGKSHSQGRDWYSAIEVQSVRVWVSGTGKA